MENIDSAGNFRYSAAIRLISDTIGSQLDFSGMGRAQCRY